LPSSCVNLVGNAIKFTEVGEIEVSTKLDVLESAEVALRFTVRDTGVGIQEEKLSSIFESFSQADVSTTRQYGGTGLGLAISSQLADRMGGRMWVESTYGEGTSFHFIARFGVQENPVETPQDRGSAELPVNVKLASRLLEKRGHNVVVAGNGREAPDLLRAEGPFDVVLMDVQMPVMDGFEATAEIRSREAAEGGHVPIIGVTAYAMAGDMQRCLDVGMDDYLSKPFIAKDLFALIEKHGED